ncbi:hypothetical protein [Micromonospora sp. LOL_023]|uniref:hypothetical protein n=1 Tax=Micromonospora sp. LOL_023 TaxID=3345418 RepID=UPI003A844C1B
MPVSTAVHATLGAAALVFALAGCGTDAGEPTVASAGGTPTVVTSGDAVTAYVEDVRRYVACLREAGVEVTDPDARGKFEYGGDARAMKSDPTFLEAQTACADLLPAMPEGLEEKPVLTSEEIEAKRSYARCMRENRVSDFPDPGPDGHWPDVNDGQPAWDQNDPVVKRAETACGPIIGAPASPGPGVG